MQLAKDVIAPELNIFTEYYENAVKSNALLMDRVMSYLVAKKGKLMRPMFVLLCAKLGGEVNEQSYRAATLVEMLHTASLVHDDMVDDASERRGNFSVNALWKNKVAVMSGDYLFASGLILSLANGDTQILKIYNEAIQQMIESELLQMVKSRKPDLSEEAYFKIINAKTASFLAAACAAGAASTMKDEAVIQKIHSFGTKAGMAFQLKDDLFDFGVDDVGKPIGNDIKEKKITLPLIYTLQNSAPAIKKKLLYIVHHKNEDAEQVAHAIDVVRASGGIAYTEQVMNQYRDDALELLYEFPASDSRSALEEMVRYITDRKY
ncbi:MAG: polyprenyl synthetase family protein [Filimonas sp.]|nr:polyprenyl synthetase family protein [Filimonas sp.]